MRQGCLFLIFVALLVVQVGCGGDKAAVVTGKVTFNGEVVETGAIRFVPADGDGPVAGAMIEGGVFTATKVHVGKNQVFITSPRGTGVMVKSWDAPDAPIGEEVVEGIPAKFNSESELFYDVTKGQQTKNFDLTK
jgi:hypothetical protein